MLAINGGTPVRTTPLPPYFPGAVSIDDDEINGAVAVLKNKTPFRYYGPNPSLNKVKEFETSLAKKFGVNYGLAVTSGTASLVVALRAAGIGVGDKVIVPTCTFIATPGAVVDVGAVPVFCEIDDSFTLNPDKIKDCVDEHVKAIIVVPILGYPCKMDRIMEEAKKYNLVVIEDVAQSMGSKFKGQYCGTFGDLGCFSLQINKILTTGEGGAVLTNDAKLYERAVRYHDQGMFREKEGFLATNEAEDIFLGIDYRMNEVNGAIACAQLRKLDGIIANMRRNKRIIAEGIRDIKGIQQATINDADGDCGNSLIILFESKEKRIEFAKAMCAEGTPIGSLYNAEPIYMVPQLLHQRTVNKDNFPFNLFPDVKYTRDMCPESVDLLGRHSTVAIGPQHTEQDCQDFITAFHKVAAELL